MLVVLHQVILGQESNEAGITSLVVVYWGQYKYKAEIASQSSQLDEFHE
jgi:hypothetical protein